jgi:nicotinate-nucleotide--dimethylbenzimidazole phosphoribosyltransferase
MVLPPPNPTGLPFEDIRDLLTRMPGPDEAAVAEVRARDKPN